MEGIVRIFLQELCLYDWWARRSEARESSWLPLSSIHLTPPTAWSLALESGQHHRLTDRQGKQPKNPVCSMITNNTSSRWLDGIVRGEQNPNRSILRLPDLSSRTINLLFASRLHLADSSRPLRVRQARPACGRPNALIYTWGLVIFNPLPTMQQNRPDKNWSCQIDQWRAKSRSQSLPFAWMMRKGVKFRTAC